MSRMSESKLEQLPAIRWTSASKIVLRETCGCGGEIAFSDYVLESVRSRELATFRENHAVCRAALSALDEAREN